MKLWDNIRESVLVREAATVVSGNVLAQVISMLAYLVLTRIFSPSDYALFNIFYSYIEVLVILSTCKYELAVVVAQDDRETSAVMRFALRLNAVVALLLLTLVAVLYFAGGLPDSFSSLGAIVLLIPPMVFFSGSSRVYAALFNRLHRYRLIAAYETTNASAGAVLKALLGLVGLKQAGLPLGAVLGQASANLLYRFRLRGVALLKVSCSEQVAAARKHRNFPLFVPARTSSTACRPACRSFGWPCISTVPTWVSSDWRSRWFSVRSTSSTMPASVCSMPARPRVCVRTVASAPSSAISCWW